MLVVMDAEFRQVRAPMLGLNVELPRDFPCLERLMTPLQQTQLLWRAVLDPHETEVVLGNAAKRCARNDGVVAGRSDRRFTIVLGMCSASLRVSFKAWAVSAALQLTVDDLAPTAEVENSAINLFRP
jgi:hypothetical protein